MSRSSAVRALHAAKSEGVGRIIMTSSTVAVLGTPLPDAKAVLIKPLPEPVALARLADGDVRGGEIAEDGRAGKRAQGADQATRDGGEMVRAPALADEVRAGAEREERAREFAINERLQVVQAAHGAGGLCANQWVFPTVCATAVSIRHFTCVKALRRPFGA